MKTKIILLLFVALQMLGQTNVDRVAKALDTLAVISFNDWKMSPDLSKEKISGNPAAVVYDDSKWKNLKLREWIYPDSCWLRKEIILPDKILGQPISGTLKFFVEIDDEGYLFINGEYKGFIPWAGEFELTQNAKPGEKVVIAIRAINTEGPMGLLRAEVENVGLRKMVNNIAGIALSLRTAQKLLSFDTYQTSSNQKTDPGTDRSSMDRKEKKELYDKLQNLAAQLDVNALGRGDVNSYLTSLEKVRGQLKPISNFVKRFTIVFASNAHIDAAWLWREKETIEVCKNTFTSVLNMMDARPDFTYTQSSAAYYDWMERLYPDLYKRIEQWIKDGRWELSGGMWIEPDCNLIDGVSWTHQLLYAQKYFKAKFGKGVKIGWNPDSFGYNWNMPQFYLNAGFDAFVTQKIGWNETNVFPYRVFWWESPDGSRILTYFPFSYVNEITDPFNIVDCMRQFEANTGFTKLMVLFGVGDHGGGPTDAMLDRIERLKELDLYPSIEFAHTDTYLKWLRSHDLSKLPVWKDELYLEYHQGTFTTQAAMKKYNRSNEVLLSNVEKFSSISSLFGGTYNRASIEEAWKKTLFNQFHDILPGSSIREVYVDSKETFKESEAIGQFELKNTLESFSKKISLPSNIKGTPLVVFNALSWQRTDVVRFDLPTGSTEDFAVFDIKGKEIASQIVQKDRFTRELLFIASDIPSMGYKTYIMKKQKAASPKTSLIVSTLDIENAFFKITVCPKSGHLKSIVDKRNGKEILKGLGNRLQLLEDLPKAWDAWNIGWTGVEFPTRFLKAEIVEIGPVRAVIRLHRDYRKPGTRAAHPTTDFPTSFFTQDVILYDGIDRIDFKTDVDWWENKTMLKVAFPLTVSDTVATYEIPYGTVQRSTQWRNSWDSAKVEVPAVRWADLSQDDYGVSLLNNSKYGHDIKDNTIRLSLLRSPKWPDPTADRGKHSIEYSLYPHKNRWAESGTVQRGYEFNNPLIAVIAEASKKGTLPVEQSFVQLSPSNCILAMFKKAEEGDAYVIQWYESEGKDVTATLTLPKQPRKAVLSNFIEADGAEVKVEKNKLVMPTKRNAVVTVKLWF